MIDCFEIRLKNIVCWDMLDLGEALEDEVVVIEKLENPRKNKNSNIWIYIAQN